MPLSKAGIQPTNFRKVASAIYPWAYLKPHILAHPDTVLSTSVMALMSGTGPVMDINMHTLEKVDNQEVSFSWNMQDQT